MKAIIYGIGIFLSILLLGCVEDATNKDIKTINRITFSGIEKEYIRNMGDSLVIQPELKNSLEGISEEENDYLWFFSTNKTSYAADTLSREKELKVEIKTLPGEYNLTYKVTNKLTGVFDVCQSKVRVDGAYSRGVLILAENDGYAQLNFLPAEGKLVSGVYEGANGEKLGTNPKRVIFVDPSKQWPALKEVYVLCGDERGGVCLNPNYLQKRKEVRNVFFTALSDEVVESELYFKPQSGLMSDYLMIGGKVYNRSFNMGEIRFKSALVADMKDYNLSPWHFSNPGTAWFYDGLNHRFLAHKTANKGELVTFRAAADTFDPNQVGLDLVCGGYGAAGRPNRIYGLFKEPGANQYSVLNINVDPAAYTMSLRSQFEIDDRMHLISASCYELPHYTYFNYLIFYGWGSQIYVYNADTNVSELLYDFNQEADRDIEVDCLEVASKTELRVGVRNKKLAGKQGGYAILKMTELGGLNIDKTVAPVEKYGFCDKVVDFETKQ